MWYCYLKFPENVYSIGSMYGIFTYIWLIFMVNVGRYPRHGWQWYGQERLPQFFQQHIGSTTYHRTPTSANRGGPNSMQAKRCRTHFVNTNCNLKFTSALLQYRELMFAMINGFFLWFSIKMNIFERGLKGLFHPPCNTVVMFKTGGTWTSQKPVNHPQSLHAVCLALVIDLSCKKQNVTPITANEGRWRRDYQGRCSLFKCFFIYCWWLMLDLLVDWMSQGDFNILRELNHHQHFL